MKSFTPYSLGAPSAFNVSPTADNYNQERLAYELSYTLYSMSDVSYDFSQEESSDVSTVLATADTFVSDVGDWLTSAVAAQVAGTSVPAIPGIGALVAGLSPQSIMIFVAQIVIRFVLAWLAKKFDGSTETGELAALFEKGFFVEEGGERVSILERALLSEQVPGSFLSNLWLLANQPVEIMLNRTGEIESISFNSVQA